MALSTESRPVGADILALVTWGMYDNPLVLFREYVQNAVDAFDRSDRSEAPKVTLRLDVQGMSVAIRDNGPGLSFEDAVRDLVAVAASRKVRGRDAGFRGIGRLVGLAFADEVVFLTRSSEMESMTQVVWRGDTLKTLLASESDLEDVIDRCVSVTTVPGDGYPSHFFEVTLRRIARFVSDRVLNVNIVRQYVAEVCPVAVSVEFPYYSQVSELVSQFVESVTVAIHIEGDTSPILRQYGSAVQLTASRNLNYQSFERFELATIEGDSIAAIGWLVHSTYDGAIPKRCGVRGLRVRRNDIAIGDESTLDHLFVEDRFNRWCIGEIHILDHRIVPNARRDYFEINPHLRNFENQLKPIVSSIVKRCRRASTARNEARRHSELVEWATAVHRLAAFGYVSKGYARPLVDRAIERLDAVRRHGGQADDVSWAAGIEVLYQRLVRFDDVHERGLVQKLSPNDACAYQRVVEALLDATDDPRTALRVGEVVLVRLLG